jgi:hypothetical protein
MDSVEQECAFCGAIVEEPCTSLEEWQTCEIGETITPIDRVKYFQSLIEDDIYDLP